MTVGKVFDSFGDDFRHPVIVSVPHAGRDYDSEYLQQLAVPIHRARLLEDGYADRLVDPVIASGGRVFIQRTPRLIIDANRAETDFDRDDVCGGGFGRPSDKARGGLGIIPTRLTGVGALWKHPTTARELSRRVATYHRPYHAALSSALNRSLERFGSALLLDLHSMPPLVGPARAKIVIGDRHGRTATTSIVESAARVFAQSGLSVAFNDPYSGGHILERHACPERGIFALQIEIDRSLYLDARLEAPGHGLKPVSHLIGKLYDTLGDLILKPSALAAE